MHFRNYGFGKPSLDNCLKRPISEDSSKSNMGSGPKHYSNLNHSNFSRFIDQCEGNLIGKISLSNMQNLRTVCEHIDSQSQVFSS